MSPLECSAEHTSQIGLASLIMQDLVDNVFEEGIELKVRPPEIASHYPQCLDVLLEYLKMIRGMQRNPFFTIGVACLLHLDNASLYRVQLGVFVEYRSNFASVIREVACHLFRT